MKKKTDIGRIDRNLTSEAVTLDGMAIYRPDDAPIQLNQVFAKSSYFHYDEDEYTCIMFASPNSVSGRFRRISVPASRDGWSCGARANSRSPRKARPQPAVR